MKIKRRYIIAALIVVVSILGLASVFMLENHQSNQTDKDNVVNENVSDNSTEPLIADETESATAQDYAVSQTQEPVNESLDDNNIRKLQTPDTQSTVNTNAKTETLQSHENDRKATTCSISIKCDDILAHMDLLKENKKSIIPSDGVIMSARTVEFHDGETVFNVLQREAKKNKIHLEFTTTPIYNSAYIEGIANIYEFDCGNLSGWMYKVNGQSPGYGSSLYKLKDGDVIEWEYTCNLGRNANGYTGE